MILDDVFGLARKVAPRGTKGGRPSRRSGTERIPAQVTQPLIHPAVAQPLRPARARPLTGRAAIPQDVLCLQPTEALLCPSASVLVTAVLRRVGASRPLPYVVVLTLDQAPDIDDDGCEALVELCYSLRASGMRLYVATGSTTVLDRLQATGAVNRMLAGTAHLRLRTALLAAFEDLPGPAVTTRDVITDLENRLTPLPI
ncbi:STAS domain-containing protein [Actinopolymorpha sp. NPDC004070]|uniref:STAS domain-containing protein n=1 Tax=Actinopolymorpha sp. NPDC004070 TaxID=3154548 RepID=UPI0033B626E8